MRKWYAKAMGIFYTPRSDWAEIALEIAQRNPSVFVRAVEAIERRKQTPDKPLMGEFQRLAGESGDIASMVAAVKLYRERTGATLKVAKKAFDDARSEWLQSQREENNEKR